MKKQWGITLVEMIIALVLMAIAIAAFTSFLVPQIRDSALPSYQTRAAALAQSFLSQIMARSFDQNSDRDGGGIRCDEGTSVCTPPQALGPDSGESNPSQFNDVDDYIGCWGTPETLSQCQGNDRGDITDVLGESSADKYRNFRVEVSVVYDNLNSSAPSLQVTNYKKITVVIFAGYAQPLTLVAIRGNY